MEDDFFEWDDVKADNNFRSHGVTFEEATDIFYDPRRIEFVDEEHSEDEGRFSVIGFSKRGRLRFVIFTPRRVRLRIISARLSERDEEERYEQGY